MTNLEKRISAIERKLYSVIDGVKVRSLNEKVSLNGTDIMYVVSLEDGNHVSRKVIVNSIKTFVLTGYDTPENIAAAIQNIADNTADIQINTNNISTNNTNIQTNVTAIQDNASDITDNDDDIAINTQNIQNNATDLSGVHDNLAGLGNLVVGNSGDITSLQTAQLQILNRLQDVEFLAAANTQSISDNVINIEKDRVVSLNESFVNAGVDYTNEYGIDGGVVHVDDGSILQTNKDCLIHYNIGSLDCTVYVDKSKQIFTDIESGKINTITMFNSSSFGVPLGVNPVFTRQPKELNFQVLINDNTVYSDEVIDGVDYRLYNSTSYGYSSEIGAGVVVGGDMIVKAN